MINDRKPNSRWLKQNRELIVWRKEKSRGSLTESLPTHSFSLWLSGNCSQTQHSGSMADSISMSFMSESGGKEGCSPEAAIQIPVFTPIESSYVMCSCLNQSVYPGALTVQWLDRPGPYDPILEQEVEIHQTHMTENGFSGSKLVDYGEKSGLKQNSTQHNALNITACWCFEWTGIALSLRSPQPLVVPYVCAICLDWEVIRFCNSWSNSFVWQSIRYSKAIMWQI